MESEILSTLFANWPRRFNVFEKARFIETFNSDFTEAKKLGIRTTPADQTRLTRARTPVCARFDRGNFTAKLVIGWLPNRSQAS